jgi:hypothetical protein
MTSARFVLFGKFNPLAPAAMGPRNQEIPDICVETANYLDIPASPGI